MIDAVLLFGFMNVLFEFVLLSMLKPRLRLRVLGSDVMKNGLHVIFLVCNLMVHWGTLIGTMASVLAFIASIVTVQLARWLFGYVVGTRYTTGLIRYSKSEII